MGGEPFLAFKCSRPAARPAEEISPRDHSRRREKAREAGTVIAGGHTVQDNEPKFGLVAPGLSCRMAQFHQGGLPGRETDCSSRKPLGFGVTTTALKREKAETQDVAEAVGWMKRLNRDASRMARN
jgi:selenide,water dikinase